VKICFLDEAFFAQAADAVNGARVQIIALARELMRRGHEVAVISGCDTHAVVDANVDRDGVPVHAFRRSARVPFLGARAASKAMRHYDPDVICVRGRSYLAGVAAWERWRRGKAFVWASNAEEGCERWKHMRHLWNGPRSVSRRVLRTPLDFVTDLICDGGVHRADQHVCQTQYQCTRLLAVHGRRGLVVRSLQSPPPDLAPKAVPPLVVWLGRVSTERGPEAFVRLAGDLVDLDCDFTLVGPASSAGYLRDVLVLAEGLTRFRYVGAVPLSEAWQWVAKAAVLVNTSPIEGVSNALVQAWHCGTPTVTLSFDPDGIIEGNGVGYRSGDPARMAVQVRRLLRDERLRDAMSARARILAARDFSADHVGTVYEQVLREAVAAHA
jgi:glycosyltransferase involved in cell wall biosynthesis